MTKTENVYNFMTVKILKKVRIKAKLKWNTKLKVQ